MRITIAIRSFDGGWKATCNGSVAELRINGDPYGAHEILMPKRGIPLERRLAEVAILALLNFLHPDDPTTICDDPLEILRERKGS